MDCFAFLSIICCNPTTPYCKDFYSYSVQLLDFATLNGQQKTSLATYSPFSLIDTFNSFCFHRPSLHLTDDNPLLGKLPTHLSAFISHLLAYYLLSRDSLMRCPQTLRAQQDLWPWSSHPWSILKKKPYFPIWSLSPTPHFSGFNNVLH